MMKYLPRVHEHEWELGSDVSSDGSEEELNPYRVWDDQPKQVLVVLVRQKSWGGQEGVIPLKLTLQSHLSCKKELDLAFDKVKP